MVCVITPMLGLWNFIHKFLVFIYKFKMWLFLPVCLGVWEAYLKLCSYALYILNANEGCCMFYFSSIKVLKKWECWFLPSSCLHSTDHHVLVMNGCTGTSQFHKSGGFIRFLCVYFICWVNICLPITFNKSKMDTGMMSNDVLKAPCSRHLIQLSSSNCAKFHFGTGRRRKTISTRGKI